MKYDSIIMNFLEYTKGNKSGFVYKDYIPELEKVEKDPNFIKSRNEIASTVDRKELFINNFWPDCISSSPNLLNQYLYDKSFNNDELLLRLFTTILIYNWRKYKKIYKFDQELIDEFYKEISENEDLNMPLGALLNLPYPTIFVEFDVKADDDDHIFNGFLCNFILLYDKYKFTHPILQMQYIGYDKIKGYFLSRSFYTNLDNKDATVNDDLERFRKKYNYRFNDIYDFDVEKLFKLSIYCLLYIVAANADISYNPTTKATYRPINKENIKDKFSEVEQFDVGVNIGKTLKFERINKKEYSGDSKEYKLTEREYKKRSAHIRKAHWHHYWTGSRTDKSKRKLIIKWIPPVFVNGNNIKPTIINVE